MLFTYIVQVRFHFFTGNCVNYTFVFTNLTATTVDPTKNLQFGLSTAGTYYNGNLFNGWGWKGIELSAAQVLQMAALPIILAPVEPTFLIFGNLFGGGSIYGVTDRNYPDEAGIVSGFQTVLMEKADGEDSDIPT